MKTRAKSENTLAVSYLRVSTKEQAERDGDPEGYSIPAQREANRRKAESLGATIIAEFVDRGESARSADRPELQRMLSFVAGTSVQWCIVHKVDRLARNRADDVSINLALQRASVRLVSATENIDETPSGMLLHGIMSSIAEFYSRNLANEVVKGMTQKAVTGGTPGKAPMGYRNAGVLNPEGREVRTVLVDPERAPLIAWAFEQYATGDWTVRNLAVELAARGLASAPTPSRPARPVDGTQLHKVLTNPYYKGVVRWRGAEAPGRHAPLVTEAIWRRVQDILSSRAVGEKSRDYPHYLKSSVFCGSCKSRLIVQLARNRHGTLYEYFVCSGRHSKRNSCTRSAMRIALIEEKVALYYRRVVLAPDVAKRVAGVLREEAAAASAESTTARAAYVKELARLNDRARKLLEGHLSGVIPTELYAEEQGRITARTAALKDRVDAVDASSDEVDANLEAALFLAEHCYEAYRRADDVVRRQFNQAFFVRLYIDEDAEVDGELAEPFHTLLEGGTSNWSVVTSRPEGEIEEPSLDLSSGEGSHHVPVVPLEGLEPPTVSLGRNCSSIELQRLAHPL
jgi:site-specific DNA recombinase